MDGIHQSYDGESYQTYFVVTEDANTRPATADFCRHVRDQFGLTMPVLYDETGELGRLGLPTSHFHMVLGEEGRIEFKEQGRDTGFRAAIDRVLGR